MRAWTLCCFQSYGLISNQTLRWTNSKSVDSCAEVKIECPFSGVTSSGRVWRKMPESDARRKAAMLGVWGRRPGHGINSLLLLVVLTDRHAVSRQLRPLRQDFRQRDFAICLRRFKKSLGEGLAKGAKVKCFTKPTSVNLRTPVSATYCRHDLYQNMTGR